MNVEQKLMTDFKAANIGEFALQMKRTDAHFLSINDALVADDDFRHWIINMFPAMGKYEIHEEGLKVPPGRAMAYRKYHATKEFRYGGKMFAKGALIPKEIIDQIKNNPSMSEVWAWK
jgi:hypothetical protein